MIISWEGYEGYMGRTKKQHYVPQVYLKNFTCTEQIWVYNRLNKKIYKSSIRDVCVKNHLYETERKNSFSDENYVLYNAIENTFSEAEGGYANILKKFISICYNKENRNALILRPAEKEEVASLISNLFVRNPVTLDVFMEGFDEAKELPELAPYTELLNIVGISESESFFKAAYKNIITFEEVEGAWPNIIKDCLINMYVYILKSPEGSNFVTASFPIMYTTKELNKNETNLKSLYVPITPRFALLYLDKKAPGRTNKILEIQEKMVNKLNLDYLKYDENRSYLILSHNKELLEKLKNKENE
jgi:hypothetical protein